MNLKECQDVIKSNMNYKNINEETQQYIIEYIKLNQHLFSNCIKIDKLVDRIVNNLECNIKYIDKFKNVRNLIKFSGYWSSYEHKIIINPIRKLESMIFKRQKEKMDSTIRHEIDHCATTEYIYVDKRQKEEYIQKFIKRNNIKGIDRQNSFRNYINNIYKQQKGQVAICGISDVRYIITDGIDLHKLNEGITAYKQELYDKTLGVKPKNSYPSEKVVAKFIANIIGREELISMHFDNNYEGIRNIFNEKTGRELNDLVKILNSKSKTYTNIFGKMYTNYFDRKLQKAIRNYKIIDLDNSEKQESKVNKEKDFREQLSKGTPSLKEQKLNSIKFQERTTQTSKDHEVDNAREED